MLRDFPDINILPSVITNGTEGDGKLLCVIMYKSILSIGTKRSHYCLIISGRPMNRELNIKPLITSKSIHLGTVLACLLYLGVRGTHPEGSALADGG